jgi:hypothetical protein
MRAEARPCPGGIQTASDEIRREAAQATAARARHERLRRLILWTDAMIEELEQENLKDVDRVSATWRPRLALLFASLPFDFQPTLRASPAPVEVLDLIYEIQEHLFHLRTRRRTTALRRLRRCRPEPAPAGGPEADRLRAG